MNKKFPIGWLEIYFKKDIVKMFLFSFIKQNKKKKRKENNGLSKMNYWTWLRKFTKMETLKCKKPSNKLLPMPKTKKK